MDLSSTIGNLVLDNAQFALLRDRLARYSGVYLDDSRQSVLRSALARRLAATGLSLPAYIAGLIGTTDNEEIYQLAELALNHETVFFRNQPQFRALREVVLPELSRRLPAERPLRIWSAGCATGEEPYSLAITALEMFGRPLARPIEIIATDLSLPALNKARVALYRGRTLSNLSPEVVGRYFERRGDSLAVRPEVRQLVSFTQHNLLDPFPTLVQQIDVVFCENVTIYFQVETCRALMARFHATLADDGYLFLGFSETLWNIFDGFRSQEAAGAFFYRKPAMVPPAAVIRSPLTEPTARSGAARSLPRRSNLENRQATDKHQPAGAEIMMRARELLDAGHPDEALELLRCLPLLGQSAPAVLALMARVSANQGELDLAVAQAHRALELDSLTTEAYILLGMIYSQQGQPLDAALQFERARYLDSEAPLISYHLAETYRQLGRAQAALREYRNALRKLMQLSPDYLLDGVAVKWLRDTCQRYIVQLGAERR